VSPRAIHFEARDPRRCQAQPDTPPADPAVVRACAEAFVLHNGYTPTPAPHDTSLLVREPFEIGTWTLLANQRRYTIEPKAVRVDCTARGCIVFFRRFNRRFGCAAVNMTPRYDQLHFGLPAAAELVGRRLGC
jgi:hypothetical protein